MNITEICAYLRNYFTPINKREDRSYIHAGSFEIKDGKISDIDFLKENQYFRIAYSDMNDGVYCNCPEDLKTLQNEAFDGCIWEMSVPPAFLKLCEDIQAWRVKNESPESANMSPFTSESFGGKMEAHQMTKAAAIYQFWASFGLPAYEENSVYSFEKVPDFPYLTYELNTDAFSENATALSCSLWYRSVNFMGTGERQSRRNLTADRLRRNPEMRRRLYMAYAWLAVL